MPTGYELYRTALHAAADAGTLPHIQADNTPNLVREGAAVAIVGTTTLSDAQQVARVLVATPVATAVYTVQTGALIEALIPGIQVGDCFYQTIQNTVTGDYNITLTTAGSGTTMVGNMVIESQQNDGDSATGEFRYQKTAADTFTITRVG